MIALDTNAILRLMLDHPEDQAREVKALIARERIFLPLTVVLEVEWALRFVYSFKRAEVVRALRAVADLTQVTVEHSSRVDLALDWAEEGMELADALHLASAERCEAFATFDRALARRAETLAAVPVRRLGDPA